MLCFIVFDDIIHSLTCKTLRTFHPSLLGGTSVQQSNKATDATVLSYSAMIVSICHAFMH